MRFLANAIRPRIARPPAGDEQRHRGCTQSPCAFSTTILAGPGPETCRTVQSSGERRTRQMKSGFAPSPAGALRPELQLTRPAT